MTEDFERAQDLFNKYQKNGGVERKDRGVTH